MRRMKPNYLSFNYAIASLSKDPTCQNNSGGGGGGGGGGVGRACYEHLMSMLELYNGGMDAQFNYFFNGVECPWPWW